MSTRVDSAFGTLADRVPRAAASKSGTRSRHVVVDGRFPGVLVAWRREASGWFGDVAYVVDERLIVERMPAGRLRPVGG